MPISKEAFAETLLEWYDGHKRDLPWRGLKDPYKIWLSEIILQQTRVAQGMPYYHSFVQAFPTVADLAAAEEDRVLRLWQGLGYYSRARNLHAAAKHIVADLGGVFPQTYQELLKLKGVGSYTAAAISSFAYGEKQAVLDGNVYRVLARVFGLRDNIADPKSEKIFRALAQSLLPESRSDDYNQAVMEFGATHCKPAAPLCHSCPLSDACEAALGGLQSLLPVKEKSSSKKNRHFHYLVFYVEGKIWMRKRDAKDVWSGLYEFYLIESLFIETNIEILPKLQPFKGLMEKVAAGEGFDAAQKHQLTHQTIDIKFYKVPLQAAQAESIGEILQEGRFVSLQEAADLPKPVPVSVFLNNIINSF